jgi:hypothetical protein
MCGLCGREAGREDPIDVRPAFYAEVAPVLPAVLALVGDPEAVGGLGVKAHTVRRFTQDGLTMFQRKASNWEATHQACVFSNTHTAFAKEDGDRGQVGWQRAGDGGPWGGRGPESPKNYKYNCWLHAARACTHPHPHSHTCLPFPMSEHSG